MGRWVAIAVVGLGWGLLAAAIVAPLVGIGMGLARPGQAASTIYGVPSAGTLLLRSVTLSAIATMTAVLLGLLPAGLLGSVRGRRLAVLTGLVLAPLLIPPQVYAYAWQLIPASPVLIRRLGALILGLAGPAIGEAWENGSIKAGLISGAWLWPVVALIVSAGWRSAGRSVQALAILDTTPRRAFFRAVLPSLRPHVLAGASLVFAATLIEFAIPHLCLAEVYPTSLMKLIEAGAPPRQLLLMAAQVWGLVIVVIAAAVISLRGVSDWQPAEGEQSEGWEWRKPGAFLWVGLAVVWLVSVGLPAAVMLEWLHDAGRWREGFAIFQREWLISLGVSVITGMLVVVLAIATVLLRASGETNRQRSVPTAAMIVALLVALIPPAALGKGFVLAYNRPGPIGDLYEFTPIVWGLGLVARYAGIGILIAWLAVGRRGNVLVEQARADGADRFGVLAWALVPAIWPSLVAAGLIVAVLAMFELVTSHMLSPPRYPSIATSILNQMHYGRDDVVIMTSLIVMVAGILLTQVCGWLLVRRRA